MKIFLDSSDVDEIREAVDTGLIDGVTTNPTLMLRSGRDPMDVLAEITELFPWTASVSAEVSGETWEEMLEMADDYIQIAPNITIKVPCTVQGLKACKNLSDDDIATNVTLVFSAAQAILAAKAGAYYVSPFVGRYDDNSVSGLELVRSISEIYGRQGVRTQVLAASLRDVYKVSRCFYNGANVVTMPPTVFEKMFNHVLTDKGLEIFDKNLEEIRNANH